MPLVTNIPASNQGTGLGGPPGFDKVTSFGTGFPNDASGLNVTNRDIVATGKKTLTKSSATSVVDIAIPSNSALGGEFFYSIFATDGTDYQVLRGHIPFSAVSKAGTLTATAGTAVEITSLSTGTFTNTVTNVTGTNKITLKLNAVPSLTATTLTVSYRIIMDGALGSVTPL